MVSTPSKQSKAETIKEKSHYLRGGIVEGLQQDTSSFGTDDQMILKFHGIYQQDNRDERKQRKQQGLEPHYSFMVRTKNPAGDCSAALYLALDKLADEVGVGTMRLTTRQGFQLHGVSKHGLPTVIQAVKTHLGTTLGACGDISRNVMGPAAPFTDEPYKLARAYAQSISDELLPKTKAYVEVWATKDDGGEENSQKVYTSQEPEDEPLYGKTYMPRKFKVTVTVPADNSVDIYTQDLGLVLIFDEQGQQVGFNLTVGGGLGRSHGAPETFPRKADHLGFCKVDEVVDFTRAVVMVQRDYGDRHNRKHARMKYLINDRGIDWFRQQVEEYAGKKLGPWQDLPAWQFEDYLGWHEQGDGQWFLGISIENGRIHDQGTLRLRTALRALVQTYGYNLRLTPNHNILLLDVKSEDRAAIDALLLDHGVQPLEDISPARRYAMACPALPTCSLALTESERFLPGLIDLIEQGLATLGLEGEKIAIRMTGCPNGCARPYMGDIGLVGSGLNAYDLYLAGDLHGTRLNQIYKERVQADALLDVLMPVLSYFKEARQPEESFGDFCNRQGLEALRAHVGQH
jgi:sulfite reductase (ferredoxin)